MMIGDGLNDAGALAQSDGGISISEDVNVFSPACDAILDAKHFNDFDKFISLSKSGVLIIKNREHTKLKYFLPFSIIAFLFFVTWLIFNLVLTFGHTIQCIQIYEIFSSGCSIL